MRIPSEKLLELPAGSKRLKVGKTYKFIPLTGGGNRFRPKAEKKAGDRNAPFKATVEKAYKRWYLLLTPKGYYTTMHMCAIGHDWEVEKA